jgi:ASC-1-like (ASCH) protein
MQHIAILSKKWKLLNQIISGEKSIESRWYVHKINPWNKIKKGETVYFKETGDNIKVKAIVSKVLQFDLKHKKIKDILLEYGKQIGFDLDEIDKWIEFYKNKNYCILIFLTNPIAIKEFSFDKSGFGNACAWLCVDDINKIKN